MVTYAEVALAARQRIDPRPAPTTLTSTAMLRPVDRLADMDADEISGAPLSNPSFERSKRQRRGISSKMPSVSFGRAMHEGGYRTITQPPWRRPLKPGAGLCGRQWRCKR